MARALKDPNSVSTLIAANTALTAPVNITGVILTNSQPLHVITVDGIGNPATGTGVDAGKTLLNQSGSAASSGNNTLVSADASKRIKVYAFTLSSLTTTATTCIFQSGASGTELWRVVLQAPASVGTGANLAISPPGWLFATSAATLLNLNLSQAQTINYSLSYFIES